MSTARHLSFHAVCTWRSSRVRRARRATSGIGPRGPVEPGPKLSLLHSTERSHSLEIVLGTDSAGVTRRSASLVLDSVLAHPGLLADEADSVAPLRARYHEQRSVVW